MIEFDNERHIKIPTELLERFVKELNEKHSLSIQINFVKNSCIKQNFSPTRIAKIMSKSIHDTVTSKDGKEYLDLKGVKEKKKKYEDNDDQGYMNYKNLERYFHSDNPSKWGVEVHQLYYFLIFLKIPISEFKDYFSKKPTHEKYSYGDILSGAYYVFVRDGSDKYKRIKYSPLWMDRLTDNFKVEYLSVENILVKGLARMGRETLIFQLDDKSSENANGEVFITIQASLPQKEIIQDQDTWLWNAGGLINYRNAPVIGQLILIKHPDAKDKDSFMAEGIKTLSYSNDINDDIEVKKESDKKTKENENPKFLDQSEIDQIIIYLSRKENKYVHPFDPPYNFNILSKRNKKQLKKAGRESYQTLKDRLKPLDSTYGWISFSRIVKDRENRDKYPITIEPIVGIFEWKFIFDDYEQKCKVVRYRANNSKDSYFEGEAILQGNVLYISLVDPIHNRSKFFIAEYNSDAPSIRLIKGISGTLRLAERGKGPRQIAVREILCYLNKEENFKKGDIKRNFITYENFLNNVKSIHRKEKQYIANQALSMLSYPNDHDFSRHYQKMIKAAKFEGEYIFITIDPEDNEQKPMLVCEMTIDMLSQVILKILKPQRSSELPPEFLGSARYYSQNLRIFLSLNSGIPEEQRFVDVTFDKFNYLTIPNNKYFTGKIMTTSSGGIPKTPKFILIRKEVIDVSTKTLPENFNFDDPFITEIEANLSMRKSIVFSKYFEL